MESGEQTGETTTRRDILRHTTAGLAFALVGCDSETTPSPVTDGPNGLPPEQRISGAPAFKDKGHRVFFVEPTDGPEFDLEILPTLKPAPQPIVGVRQNFEKKYPKWDYFVWAAPDEARNLAESPSVESVVEKQVEDICEIGTPENALGIVALRFMPNSEYYRGDAATFATTERIILDWREATRDLDGIVINPAPKPDPSIEVGQVPEGEQVVIRFATPKLDPRVLDLIRKHPQTMYMKWGEMFTVLYCPPCGQG